MNKSAWNGLSWIVGQMAVLAIAYSFSSVHGFANAMALWAVLIVLVDIRFKLGELQ